MRLAGQMFSGECRLTGIHDSVQTEADNATWAPEFQSIERPERRVVESLLRVFHFCGMCCVIVGDLATYVAGKFANSSDVIMYVAVPLHTNTCQSDACLWNWVGKYYTVLETMPLGPIYECNMFIRDLIIRSTSITCRSFLYRIGNSRVSDDSYYSTAGNNIAQSGRRVRTVQLIMLPHSSG
jgi:hypothetical protein